ncbi:MAG: hypothetical protein HC927_01085 [Deltaproteobacteria bacterium]|nr:hypothetical protein [Deltaproteobacteria bacterium]
MSSEANQASNSEPPQAATSNEGAAEPASREDSRMTRLLARGIAVVGLLVIVFHFTVTIVYINPISVVGLVWRQQVVEYLEPLFSSALVAVCPRPADARSQARLSVRARWPAK